MQTSVSCWVSAAVVASQPPLEAEPKSARSLHKQEQSYPDLSSSSTPQTGKVNCSQPVLPRSRHCQPALQDAVGDETADQVSVNFFGDGTCNMGEACQYRMPDLAPATQPMLWPPVLRFAGRTSSPPPG